jgi:outer membrane protein insertion porin family
MTKLFALLRMQKLLTAAFVLAALAAATLPPSLVQAAVANRIVVEGNQRVDDATVAAYVLVQPGENYSAQEVDESLKALFETGLFADVQIQQAGGDLVVTVVENPVINEIAFEGNKRFKDAQLATVIQSEARGVFTRAKVQGDVQRILELYRRGGRYQASVTPQTIELQNGAVNLVFVVAEGPSTGVSTINFIGNQAFGDQRLRSVIQTRQSGYFGFLRSTDTYDPDRLSGDEEKLRNYYLDRGYADFQVVSSVADLDRERNTFFITFTVNEGPRYRFGQIAVDSTIPGVDTAQLQRLVTTDEGDVFSNARIEESLEAITVYMASAGFPFAEARPRLDRNPEGLTIGVTYVVDEGSRVYVERIDVRNNARTRDYVIRREFDIAEGDAYNRVLVERAERRLRNLGYFSDVRVTTEPGATPDRVILVADVTEQPTGEFSFGAGYSTAEGIVGDVSLTERNFLGRGYLLRASAGGGSNSRNYEFGFTDPYFLGRRVSAGFNVFRREYDETRSRNYNFDTTGGGLTFGFPITENFTVQVGNQIEYKEIDVEGYDLETDLAGSPDDPNTPAIDPEPAGLNCKRGVSRAVCQSEGETLTSSVNYSLIYDSLDNRRDPRDGILARFTQEFAGVGGDVSFLRTTATASYFQEILPDRDVIGFLKVQGGHITGIGEDVRLSDAFFKGGDLVRGFESSGIGPRDMTVDSDGDPIGDALGGKVFFGATAEAQFPFPVLPPELGFKGAVFADAGTLFGTDFDQEDVGGDAADPILIEDDASIRSSIGASILWASPLGPLRADVAYALSKEDYDETQVFRFGGGGRF